MSETAEKLGAKCSVVGCGQRAEWRIADETMEDEYTDVCGDHINMHVSSFLRRVRPINTAYNASSVPGLQVTINATGTEEFDRLLDVLTTIHLMTNDDRIKAFIEMEAAQVPGSPLTHTFDLLRKAMQPGGEEIHTYLFGALSYLDDARHLVEENTPLFVVLDALHKYLDGLVGKRVVSQ